ncbi:hypothetical protein EMIT0232MI5_100162 [Pseudomonas sp. IT-232MI5]
MMNGRSFWSRLGRNSPQNLKENWHCFLQLPRESLLTAHADFAYTYCVKAPIYGRFTQYPDNCS